MAWYYGTYSCGHEGRTNVVGPVKNRQWIADRHFEGVCPECWQEHLEDQREREYQMACKMAEEMELPELQGTDKQIRWAMVLRQKLINNIGEKSWDDPAKVNEVLHYILTTKVKASWYIDNRNNNLEVMFTKAAKEYEASLNTQSLADEKAEKETLAEATVIPTDQSKSGIVEIVIKDNVVEAYYKKDEDFRELVKGLGYYWSSDKQCWAKNIKETTGTAQDRAGELGNKLLNAGFAITLMDNDARQKAIDGSFKPEHTRWIMAFTNDEYKGMVGIKWRGKDDNLYHIARKLPRSKWGNPYILVRVEYYKEIEEFAKLHDFQFTLAAQKLIQQYKKSLKRVDKVTP